MQSEKSEMLTIYDENMNPIGERTRKEVHENELRHQTVRLWEIAGGQIWFQQRAQNKVLFPGRFDLAATGHIDPGESPMNAALRETSEEIGLNLTSDDLHSIGLMPFGFDRPDGKLDNEFANIYLHMPDKVPKLQISDEVAGLGSMSVRDYDKLIRTGQPVTMNLYSPESFDGPVPKRIGVKTCGPDDFCCLNKQEWAGVQRAVAEYGPKTQIFTKGGHDVSDLPSFDSGQDGRSDEFCKF